MTRIVHVHPSIISDHEMHVFVLVSILKVIIYKLIDTRDIHDCVFIPYMHGS